MEDTSREPLTNGERAAADDRALRKEETANAVSPLMGSAIDALPCARPAGAAMSALRVAERGCARRRRAHCEYSALP
jgi:hypothetical protein